MRGEVGQVVHGLEQHAGDVVGQQLDLLVRVVDGHLVHPLELGHRRVDDVEAGGAPVPAGLLVVIAGAGERFQALPVGQVPDRGIGGNEVVQVGGSRSGQPADDDRPLDRDVLDLGVRRDERLQPKPVDQVAHQLFEHHRRADTGESGLLAQRRAQDLESLAERRVAPVVESGALACRLQQRLRGQSQRGAVARRDPRASAATPPG